MKNNLQELFREYISECQYSRGLRTETIKGYKASFYLFDKIMPEVKTVEFVTVEMLNEFFKRIRTRERIVGRDTVKVGLRDSTIKTYATKLDAFFKWLVRMDFMESNPLLKINIPSPEYTDSRALTEEEVRKIYAAIVLNSNNDPLMLRRDTVMVSLLFFCGLRKGEFISLRVMDIDMEKKLLIVRGETSKSKMTRILPIHPTLFFHLGEYFKERNKKGYKTESLIVSVNKDVGLSRDGLKHWVEKIKKNSGVKFHLHRFRHTFACNLGNNDVGDEKIKKFLGHKKIEMTQQYLRSIHSENLRDDINKLSI
jgi:site-specific recombinase XerD